jgi:hypothetical protein
MALAKNVTTHVSHVLEGPITTIRAWFAEQLEKDVQGIKQQVIEMARKEISDVWARCEKLETELVMFKTKKKGRK